MQHRSLTAQITSKGKKHLENFQPTFFSQIPYSNVTEINYLRDLQEKKQQIDFPIFEFQKDFGEQAPVNEFDMLANTLYKKIMQQGYIQQKKAPSKKKKKTKNPFEYDYEDAWINDQEAITVKKNIYVKLQNFKCLSQGIDEFYNSELYKSSLSQIQQQSKKRTNEITMDAQQLEQIKKKIKQNISITKNKMREELQAQKPTTIGEVGQEDVKLQQTNEKIENQNIIKNQISNNIETPSSSAASQIKQNQNEVKESDKQVNLDKTQMTNKKSKKPTKSKQTKKSNKNEKKQKDIEKEQKMIDESVKYIKQENGKQKRDSYQDIRKQDYGFVKEEIKPVNVVQNIKQSKNEQQGKDENKNQTVKDEIIKNQMINE